MENIENEIKKSFANLSALKQNLPDKAQVNEDYVKIFHKEIDRLVNLGYKDLEEFKIPNQEITSRQISWNPYRGSKYSEERYVEKGLLLTRLDAVLTFFQIYSEKIEMGFQPKN